MGIVKLPQNPLLNYTAKELITNKSKDIKNI